MAVMIGIDPHKRSHTAVAINGTDEVLGQLRVTADRRQLDRLLGFAATWPERVWAVENANGLGRLLSVSRCTSNPAHRSIMRCMTCSLPVIGPRTVRERPYARRATGGAS